MTLQNMWQIFNNPFTASCTQSVPVR